MSKLFEKLLGPAYRPEIHWTSAGRSKAGLNPYSGNERIASTFTISGDAASQAMIHLLLRHGYRQAASWKSSPTFHVEVSSTEGDITTAFVLQPEQVEKVRTRTKD